MSTAAFILYILTAITHLNSGSCLALDMKTATEESVTEIFETTPAPTALDGLFVFDSLFGHRLKRQSAPTSQVTRFKRLMRLIEAGKLQDCAGRVVCDLNCDAGRYGPGGEKVLGMMNKVQDAGVMDVEDMQLLGTAGASGRVYYWTTGCSRCRDVYPSCFTETEQLIDVASIFDMESF